MGGGFAVDRGAVSDRNEGDRRMESAVVAGVIAVWCEEIADDAVEISKIPQRIPTSISGLGEGCQLGDHASRALSYKACND